METIDIRELDLGDGDRLLDVGCGDGRHVRGALAHSDGVFAVGTDLSLRRLRDAFRKFWEFPLRGSGSLVMSDLHRLPFAASRFQAVVCSEVLEHLHDYRSAIREMARVLQPGGTLAISVPMFLSEKGCWKLSDDYPGEAGHLRIFRTRELVSAFEKEGLRKIRSHGTHAFHTPFWWLMCCTGELLPLAQNPDPFEHEAGTRAWWREWYEGGKQHPSRLVSAYYGFLVWYEQNRGGILGTLETLLNPVLGRSHVLYFRKPAPSNVPRG